MIFCVRQIVFGVAAFTSGFCSIVICKSESEFLFEMKCGSDHINIEEKNMNDNHMDNPQLL